MWLSWPNSKGRNVHLRGGSDVTSIWDRMERFCSAQLEEPIGPQSEGTKVIFLFFLPFQECLHTVSDWAHCYRGPLFCLPVLKLLCFQWSFSRLTSEIKIIRQQINRFAKLNRKGPLSRHSDSFSNKSLLK